MYKFSIVTHKYNTGIPRALITGIEAAQGYYITFIGQDDLYAKDKVQQQVLMLDNNPDMVANYTGKEVFYSNDPSRKRYRILCEKA